MQSQTLNGVKLLFFSQLEHLRSEAYALLSQEGWQFDLELPETTQEFEAHLKTPNENTLIIIAEPNVRESEKFNLLALEKGWDSNQILFGLLKGSLHHRLIARSSHVQSFIFDFSKTATGPQIELDDLTNQLIRLWNYWGEHQLQRELKLANESGMLSLLDNILMLDNDVNATQRAHLTISLLNAITPNLEIRKKAIRYSLFYDLHKVQNYETVINRAPKLWILKKYFDETKQYLDESPFQDKPWTKGMSIETLVTMVSDFLWKNVGQWEDKLNTMLLEQGLEFKMAIKMSAKTTMKHIEELRREAS